MNPRGVGSLVGRWILAASGMAGLRLDRSPLQIGATAAVIGLTLVPALLLVDSRERSIAYVIALWFVYGPMHILFFRSGGHDRMRRGLGVERATLLYECLLGAAFFHHALCQVRFLEFHRGSLPFDLAPSVVLPVSLLLALGGLAVKFWATLEAGLGAYYFQDLFLDRSREVGLARSGPYALLENPMYGIGLAPMYGAALHAQSWEGLLLAFAFQATNYVFLFAVERPFLLRTYPAGEPAIR